MGQGTSRIKEGRQWYCSIQSMYRGKSFSGLQIHEVEKTSKQNDELNNVTTDLYEIVTVETKTCCPPTHSTHPCIHPPAHPVCMHAGGEKNPTSRNTKDTTKNKDPVTGVEKISVTISLPGCCPRSASTHSLRNPDTLCSRLDRERSETVVDWPPWQCQNSWRLLVLYLVMIINLCPLNQTNSPPRTWQPTFMSKKTIVKRLYCGHTAKK